MIFPSYYYINEYNIFIKFVNDKIIINLIDMQQNIFEIVINSETLNDIFIINDSKLSLYGFYLILIDIFEQINENYIIELYNNDKYIRITFRDNSYVLKCILWIKEKKYKYIDENSYLEIIAQVIEEINTPKQITFFDYIITLIKKIF